MDRVAESNAVLFMTDCCKASGNQTGGIPFNNLESSCHNGQLSKRTDIDTVGVPRQQVCQGPDGKENYTEGSQICCPQSGKSLLLITSILSFLSAYGNRVIHVCINYVHVLDRLCSVLRNCSVQTVFKHNAIS